jgi:hypothetical protein
MRARFHPSPPFLIPRIGCTGPECRRNVSLPRRALRSLRHSSLTSVFDEVRQAFRELLHGNVPPEGRRELIAVMKDTLVQARIAMDDLKEAIEVTRKRVAVEMHELETIRRRRGLAQNVGDEETVRIAERFETQHVERLAVLEQKLSAQESEFALVDREVNEMKDQLKAAMAGVGSGMRAGTVDTGADPLDEGKAALEQQLNELKRAERRASADADADARLAELKKRLDR